MRLKGRILMTIKKDPCGSLLVRPVSDKHAMKYARIVAEFCNLEPKECMEAYIEEWRADEFLEEHVPRRYHSHFKNGYSVRFLADPWVMGHLYGYDAHLAFE